MPAKPFRINNLVVMGISRKIGKSQNKVNIKIPASFGHLRRSLQFDGTGRGQDRATGATPRSNRDLDYDSAQRFVESRRPLTNVGNWAIPDISVRQSMDWRTLSL
jgi:hypothetical protein